MTPDRRLYKLIQTIDRITIERILNSTPDKEIAVSVTYFTDPEREVLFLFLSRKKKQRVKEEIQRAPQLKYDTYKAVIEKLIKAIEANKQDSARQDSTYFRPSGRNK